MTKLFTLQTDALPVLRNALGPGIDFKMLFADPAQGSWAIQGIFGPGIQLPAHIHTGATHAFTQSGTWYYAEHPEQPQTAGSYLYEPATGVAHTFCTPPDNTEATVVTFLVSGANVNFTPDGQFHSILDAGFIRTLALQLAEQQGVAGFAFIDMQGPTLHA